MKTLFRIFIIMSLLFAGSNYYAHITEKNIDDTLLESEKPIKPLRQGTFSSKDTFHKSEGKVVEYMSGGNLMLRFEDFYVKNGLMLRVLLSKGGENASTTQIARLKGNSGNQNYNVPKDIDSASYDTILIYSAPLQTVFSSATLK